MLSLDEDDYEALGWGSQHSETSDLLHLKRLAADSRNRARVRPTKPVEPPSEATVLLRKARRYEHLKKWRAKNKQKYAAIEKKYAATPKRRASRSDYNKRYYERKKAQREQEKA